jgi:hypothetical protein
MSRPIDPINRYQLANTKFPILTVMSTRFKKDATCATKILGQEKLTKANAHLERKNQLRLTQIQRPIV